MNPFTIVEARGFGAVKIYQLKFNRLYIDALATSPENIAKRESSGAATALVEEAFYQRMKKCKGVKGRTAINLVSLNDALPFYERIGFKKLPCQSSETLRILVGKPLRKFLREFGGRALCAENGS